MKPNNLEKLLESNYEFRKLFNDHEKLERKLARMEGRRYLSESEEMERKRMQKLKLQRKDRMEQILRSSASG